MDRNELIAKLDELSVKDQSAPYSDAANEIRHLLVYIEQLKERLHGVNERLLNARTDIQLLEARARHND